MRKSVINYHVAGFRKVIDALGSFEGDPYDAAVSKLKSVVKAEPKPAKKPARSTTSKKK